MSLLVSVLVSVLVVLSLSVLVTVSVIVAVLVSVSCMCIVCRVVCSWISSLACRVRTSSLYLVEAQWVFIAVTLLSGNCSAIALLIGNRLLSAF